MAVQLINIGNVANDGTGDDLREAFIKVNQNFEELDLRDDEQTTVSNLGTVGEGVFAQKINYDLQFKKINGSEKVTVSSDNNTITIAADVGLDTLTVNTDGDGITLDNVAAIGILGGEGIATSLVDGNVVINNLYNAELVEDLTPQLGGALDAQGYDLNSVGNINASQINGAFVGNLTGLVYGYDIRNWAAQNEGFDFGSISPDYSSIIEFLISQQDIDFGTFGNPATGNVDLGSI